MINDKFLRQLETELFEAKEEVKRLKGKEKRLIEWLNIEMLSCLSVLEHRAFRVILEKVEEDRI